MDGINVLSLFDGMSCGRIALERAGIKVDNYFASEIDKHAIKVTQHNYPNTIQIGDVTKISYKEGVLYTENGIFEIGEVDLLIGGFPCQTLSLANRGGGNVEDGKSSLFFEMLRIIQEVSPKRFLAENVKMNTRSKELISELLGVEDIKVNSSLVSIQNRERLYWTNLVEKIEIEDRKILLKDLHCEDFDENLILKGKGLNKLQRPRNRAIDINSDKTPTLMKSQEKLPTDSIVFKQGDIYRYPTIREAELMQTVPIGYTYVEGVSYNNKMGMLGNGWTVDVIVEFFKPFIKEMLSRN